MGIPAEKLKRITSELNQLNRELEADGAPDLAALSELRQALDDLRLTVWSTSELLQARHAGKNPDGIVTFLIGERLRRFEQMVDNLCADFDRQALPHDGYVVRPLYRAVAELQQRIKRP